MTREVEAANDAAEGEELMDRFELSWTAPEGKVARADLDGVRVESNAPVGCRTWWFASVLAAKIAYDNESLTQRVCDAAEFVEIQARGGVGEVEVNGWKFTIREVG